MMNGKKNLLIVSAVFPPVVSSGIHRIVRISRYLSEMGVGISVLTLDEKSLPRSYKYDHEILKKIPDAVKIYRVPALQLLKKMIDLKNRNPSTGQLPGDERKPMPPPQASKQTLTEKSAFQKLKDTFTNNLNTPDNYALWIYPAIKAGTKIIREQGIRNVFSSSPPGSSHVVSYNLKKRTRANWIADFRDPWAQKRWFNPEMTPFKRRKIQRFEQTTVRAADTLIMNTPELLADFKSHYGVVIDEKAVAITNGFDPADFADLPGPNGQTNGEIVICHTGTFYRQRSPMPFLNGLRDAIKSGEVSKKFKVKFIGGVGDFAAQVDRFLSDNHLNGSVEIIPPIPHKECLSETMRSDVLLIVQPVT
ncbi:MAG: hypothetical protein ACE5I1_21580, partial [bacterium]